MNTIASLTRSRPADAERAVEDLADLFRASLSDARERVTLGEELDLANQYLRIEQLRLGDRLEVDWDVADLPAGATVPALVVQPLLENAIYHGIERRPTGGLVRVHGAQRDSQVQIVIENPLADAGGAAARDGNQLAQENVRQRLEAHFGKQGRLEVHKQGDRYQAILTFPYQIERAL